MNCPYSDGQPYVHRVSNREDHLCFVGVESSLTAGDSSLNLPAHVDSIQAITETETFSFATTISIHLDPLATVAVPHAVESKPIARFLARISGPDVCNIQISGGSTRPLIIRSNPLDDLRIEILIVHPVLSSCGEAVAFVNSSPTEAFEGVLVDMHGDVSGSSVD